MKTTTKIHIEKINSFKTEVAKKIKSYIKSKKLFILPATWQSLSDYDLKKHKCVFSAYLIAITMENSLEQALAIANYPRIDYLYDFVSADEIKKFEKETWPKLVQAYKNRNSIESLRDELENLHKIEDETKRKIKFLENKIASKAMKRTKRAKM